MLVCMSYSKSVIMSHSLHTTTITPTYPGATGGKKWIITICLILQFLSCHWCLLLSLTTPSLTSTFSQCGSGYPLAALSAPHSFFFFGCNRGPLSVVVCCMLALSSSSPLCWQPGVGGWGVGSAYAPVLASSLSVQLTLIAWSYCLN